MATRDTKFDRGSVLIVALLAMAFVMVLLLALLTGASHQVREAQNDTAYAREKMLADSAVALVISQVQQASTQPGQAWISQPGLLRTYDASHLRKPTACYKLYSTAQLEQMTDTSGTLQFLADDVPSDWNSAAKQAFFTDLNAPQQTSSGQSIYPILDPAALTNVKGISTDSGGVEMPVAWLYQLQDGTFGPASNATKANPIVARIAFWTDDDTNKIDINTAGCGTGWNLPRANSTDDVTWSATQPANGEFSSYPGHPAAISLAAVFDSLSPQELLGLTPRYAWGGSQFGTQATTAGQPVPLKTDRLYTSIDELRYGTTLTDSGQRATNPPTASQIETARFVLTAHSESPETTMLGEPRIAIWPVSDTPQDAAKATDRAILAAATIGAGTNARNYLFQRRNALSATDDLDPHVLPSNAQLFNELVQRGNVAIPGYGTTSTFSQKYPGAAWTQLALEMTDFIRGLNAVDPSPSPFVPFAAGDSSGIGRGFIVPLTTTYGSGAAQTTLRGMGRCPTLSSLTLIFYVCGFGFDDGTQIDYDTTPDDQAGTNWNANFALGSATNRWKHVTSELIRAFIVPCTFQPGCAYPEVSDACDIQISGLDGISVSSGAVTGNFGFATTAHSHLLCDALQVLPAERMWGGNEGPLVWRAAALDQMNGGSGTPYAFAGTKPFKLTLASSPQYNAATKKLTWPTLASFTFGGVNGLTVLIRDRSGNTLQTLTLNLSPVTVNAPPTINGECDHMDGSIPATSATNWSTSDNARVVPSYYMCLRNRLLATQNSRPFMIQAGDVSRSVEANTDLRVIAGLTNVPATFFKTHPNYSLQANPHAHNLRFADGTSAYGASGLTQLVTAPYPNATQTMTGTDWSTGNPMTPSYTWSTSPACSRSTGSPNLVTMSTPNINGDWDTGPGLCPDGALINLPDAGTSLAPATAYFSLDGGQVGAATQRTPNALVPSPVVFGSLPAGINPSAQSTPWRTLLFCPYPAGDASHPGFITPPDYLLLDHFWMPVVEPYPISTCMTTTGKINLNNQIAPFTWLHRRTAFHALLNDLRIPAIPVAMANKYKSPGTPIASIWDQVDEDATIAQIENRFVGGDAYLTEGEICTVPLVPKGLASSTVTSTQTALDSFWNSNQGAGRLTGDNLRELPYAQLYGRLTTRSNSYTVHVRVQVLKKITTDPSQNVWNEGVDLIQGDWRGSYEIERYLDPAATAPAAGQPLGPYKYRIVSSRRFSP